MYGRICLLQLAILTTLGNGAIPCSNCVRQSRSCIYPPSRRGKRAKHTGAQRSTLNTEIHVIPYQVPQDNQSIGVTTITGPGHGRGPMTPVTSSRPDHQVPQES